MKNSTKNKEQGFVYILTNPSFREDWVKIGKSERPVDVRSEELDNSSVPLPFEIYATVQTVKYNELESEFHKILTELADARIRKGREFFNITPEKAFERLVGIAKLIDDVIVNAPNENEIEIKNDNKKNCKKTSKGKYVVKTNEIFYFYSSIADAKMQVIDGNKYLVLKGAKIDKNVYSDEKNVKKIRDKNKNKLVDGTTTEDIEFDSPSTAGEFVRGGATNGKIYWRTKEDKKLEEFIEYFKN